MFDDGYEYLCLNFISQFENEASTSKQDARIYCGCIEYLENNASPLPGSGTTPAHSEPS